MRVKGGRLHTHLSAIEGYANTLVQLLCETIGCVGGLNVSQKKFVKHMFLVSVAGEKSGWRE